MRNISITFFIVLILASLALLYVNFVQANNVFIPVNDIDVNLNSSLKKINGIGYLPLRPVMEALGWKIIWNPAEKSIIGIKQDDRFVMEIIKGNVFLNGRELVMDNPPVIVNDTAYVESKFIARQFGNKIKWDKKENHIIISDDYSGSIDILGNGNIIVAGEGIILDIFEPFGIETAYDAVNEADGLLSTDFASDAIEKYQTILENISFDQSPEIYARVMNGMGDAYSLLSQVSDRKKNISTAISCYELALNEYTKSGNDKKPFLLASLANSRCVLADCAGDSNHLTQAINEYNQALEALNPEQSLLDYAFILLNKGKACGRLGSQSKAVGCLTEAERLYREALKENTFSRSPTQYAVVRYNLGNIYRLLSEITGSKEYIIKSRESYEMVLKVWTPESFPMDYARVSKSLGDIWQEFNPDGGGKDLSNLFRALEYYQEALKINTPEKYPLDYAQVKFNQCNTYISMFEADNKAEYINAALECCLEAEKVYQKSECPLDYQKVCEKRKHVEMLIYIDGYGG